MIFCCGLLNEDDVAGQATVPAPSAGALVHGVQHVWYAVHEADICERMLS